MPEERLQSGAYRILRYTPNLLRDEFVNIGVLLHARAEKRLRLRMLEETEFGRLRRLHPHADLELLRALEADFEKQAAAQGGEPETFLAQLEDTLSNVLQLSPQRGLLAEDFDAELERIYSEQVRPPAVRSRLGTLLENSAAWIRSRVKDIFRQARIYQHMRHGVAVAEFTFPGDPLKLDHAYRKNGTRGFVHAVSLGREPGAARSLAFTVERMRRKIESCEFVAVCETEPRAGEKGHQFVAELFRQPEVGIELVSVSRLGRWAQDLAATLRAG